MIKKDYAYYWNHPDEYPRLKKEDLKYESTVLLCEFMLSDLREEIEETINITNKAPKDNDIRYRAIEMKHALESPVIDALTFGHGEELVDELVKRCPKGVFDEDDNNRKDEKMERRKRHHIKANGNPLRYKRVAAGPN